MVRPPRLIALLSKRFVRSWESQPSQLPGIRISRGRDGDCSPPPAQSRSVRLSRIRLLPRVSDGKSLFGQRLADVNRSFFLFPCGLTYARQPRDTFSRLCVRPECCWFAFPLVRVLGPTSSAAAW